ncbi:type IV toxin-antitoxin system AbiEi family antitoxin domain-containing protein [Arthrobacter polaris]|uniref:type IV toxin-antitoxin system AbiEi family antitoxin domain-containing protein n=1 Tax=Arthrobacter polaris TaxID=2813727 RepID=UPI001F2489CB|nr:type IV toxin-antitoxin system AbiEi family antitoxin domain-containing protein [Arthrobacter polaris]UIK88305.1 type IV toxin-antitoxin system AbiEi family antitoxin domain-containing protein [Arthrobacter polaris]
MEVLTKLEQLREIALDQHGFVTTGQAIDAGLGHADLSKLVARGRLERVAHGVYRVPQVAETDMDQYQLAVLWAGTAEACLSHETALAVRGISDINPDRIHLTVSRARRIRRGGGEQYIVHRADLEPREIIWWEGIRATSVPTAIRQCIETGVPTYLIKQALQEARGTSILQVNEHTRLGRMLKSRDDAEHTA